MHPPILPRTRSRLVLLHLASIKCVSRETVFFVGVPPILKFTHRRQMSLVRKGSVETLSYLIVDGLQQMPRRRKIATLNWSTTTK